MLGDLSGAKCMKLICDISEAIKRELDILIVVSLEAVEEVGVALDAHTDVENLEMNFFA